MLLFTEVTVLVDSRADGLAIGMLEEPRACRVLAVAGAAHGWDWNYGDPVLRPGDRLAVAATRSGLARLLLATKSAAVPAPESRLRRVAD